MPLKYWPALGQYWADAGSIGSVPGAGPVLACLQGALPELIIIDF